MTTEYKPAVGPFWAFTRICLEQLALHLPERSTYLKLLRRSNFFLSGVISRESGKIPTVIDALQLVLLGDTTGSFSTRLPTRNPPGR